MSNTTYLRSPINFLGFLNIIEKDIEYKVLDGFRVYCTIVIIRTAPPPPPPKKKKKKKNIYIYIYRSLCFYGHTPTALLFFIWLPRAVLKSLRDPKP